ncbi:hypothetical protein [Colwellia hornerae]|uniref:Uncharacterized protein n=1 Tax=Colwellia hornerae TaxID=89402 RepID=A0A5C6QCI2_9GAMM|nr:hypothetical protein [Colwellia hornerae]TWX55169.1 hypothetical protein ESZ28_06570 [Colwellia hornerae]TWX61169.1 hypothetical protein ESZ26_05345 [Colwellia hornerae]TWX66481.1 hypothetical protein ESZ27_10670 [Colwellia hornerae]
MKNIEKSLAQELSRDGDLAFSTSDDEFFKRAAITANNQQGTKDLVALGLASLWVVFISLFMKVLKPIFKNMAPCPKTISNHTTNNENK